MDYLTNRTFKCEIDKKEYTCIAFQSFLEGMLSISVVVTDNNKELGSVVFRVPILQAISIAAGTVKWVDVVNQAISEFTERRWIERILGSMTDEPPRFIDQF